jgi:hypothetical protein
MTNTAEDGHAYYVRFKPTIWYRLGFRARSPERPDIDELVPEWAPSLFVVEAKAHLDWKDRIRILVSGNIVIESVIKTDVAIGRSEATSGVGILPPGALRPR